MIHLRTIMYSGLLASLLLLSACNDSSTAPAANNVVAQLSGSNEIPTVVGEGSGTFKASLDQQTRALKWTINYSQLSGPVTAAHFHGPATAEENAGVLVPITGNLVVSPIEQTITLTAAQMAELLAGKWYLNLHTAANPKGEIRGQVTVQK